VSPAQIEREAVRLFSEKTYAAVGVRDISDAVGLLPGSLYVHIESKEAILLKIVERGIQKYLSALTPIVNSTGTAGERLGKAIRIYIDTLEDSLNLSKVAIFQWQYLSESSRGRVVELRAQFHRLFETLIEDGVNSGEFSAKHPRIVTIGIIGLLNSTMHWYSPAGPVPAEEIGEQLTELVLAGLRR
jgi:AcrR family transcriptional regulator